MRRVVLELHAHVWTEEYDPETKAWKAKKESAITFQRRRDITLLKNQQVHDLDHMVAYEIGRVASEMERTIRGALR